jgi:HD-GYP domain-containing protein (c-di-GMP phosphodiesterase class II)
MAHAHAKRRDDLRDRERLVEASLSATFLMAAAALLIWLPAVRTFDAALAAGLVAAYALVSRVEFNTGEGWAAPTQLVLVPMLFLLPPAAVPLCVVAALLLGRLPDYLSGAMRAKRALSVPADAWHAIGPALVLGIAGGTAATLGDWPIYVLALGSQFAFDLSSSMLRATVGLRVPRRVVADELRSIFAADALLAPVGLLAALAAADQPWAFVLVLPMIGLIAVFAREREARIQNAITLSDAYRGTAHLLGEVLTASHDYTGVHSRSVVLLAHQVGVELELDDSVLREVEFGALLHDVGKMAVPTEVLNKPTSLDADEWALMQQHTMEGERMLARIGGVLEEVGTVIRSHHERFDGSGYPDGLRGDEIPISARVIACCDAFNAMTTNRPYRAALQMDEAIDELRANSGTQFDPRVVKALITVACRGDAREAGEFGEEQSPRGELVLG